ncbi:hypothetical protein CVU75_02050 [Candidatus Dependentiae bacterium HGW-Dependentiae-1]|nr:MAG: hypothetical protein CVU75_02050 [Candidatus Dependentiae bacterium HGW-Dependentiae-1]
MKPTVFFFGLLSIFNLLALDLEVSECLPPAPMPSRQLFIPNLPVLVPNVPSESITTLPAQLTVITDEEQREFTDRYQWLEEHLRGRLEDVSGSPQQRILRLYQVCMEGRCYADLVQRDCNAAYRGSADFSNRFSRIARYAQNVLQNVRHDVIADGRIQVVATLGIAIQGTDVDDTLYIVVPQRDED